MILLFSFIIIIILIVLILLSQQGKISSNIPLIYIFFILIVSPFLYLGRFQGLNTIESFAGNSSLSIYFTNTEKKDPCGTCSGICDSEDPEYNNKKMKSLEMIDNPVQSRYIPISMKTININLYAAGNPRQGSGFTASIHKKEKVLSSIYNIDPGFYIVSIYTPELIKYSQNPNDTQFLPKRLKKLDITANNLTDQIIGFLNNSNPDTYLLMGTSGNNLNGFTFANNEVPATNIALLMEKYQLKFINQLDNGDSFVSIIYKKDAETFIDVQQVKSASTNSFGAAITGFDLLKEGTALEIQKSGMEFQYEETKDYLESIYKEPFALATNVLISPVNSKTQTYMVISVENNKTFVYLSSKKPGKEYETYSMVGPKDGTPMSYTFLNTKQPQKWVFEPVYMTDYENVFFIYTFDKPRFYLETDTSINPPGLKVNMFKAGSEQYWKVIEDKNMPNNYKIQNVKTGKYLSYANADGYLYDDSGMVFLNDSSKYNWKFTLSGQNKKDKNMQPFDNVFTDFTSPNDYPWVNNPRFSIKQGKLSVSSNGRAPWNEDYTDVWNGLWIYYGTIKTYQPRNKFDDAKFLEIKLSRDGNGTVNDPYLSQKIKVRNAGANILFGILEEGKYRGYFATFELLPQVATYQGPSKTYPVKMKYIIFNNENNFFNLSGANPRNLNSYSVKFDGKQLEIANFLEANGVPTTMDPVRGIGMPM